MTAPHDDLARTLAARLAPSLDDKLPARVERVLAGEDVDYGDGGEERPLDPASQVVFAGFVVSVAKAAWDIAREVRAARTTERQVAEAGGQAARIEALAREVVFLRGAVLSQLRVEVAVPPEVHAQLRELTLEAAAEEIVAGEPRGFEVKG